MVEEADIELWQRMFATHVMGPVALTKALLPSMRAAGEGRIVLVSSTGGVRGMPGTAPYSAAKGALERWGESLAGEIAPFGLGVTVLVTGTYDTDIITDAGTTDDRNFDGPYARHSQHHEHSRPICDEVRAIARALRRRAAEGAGGQRAVPPAGRGARRVDAVDRQQAAAASGMHHMSRLVMGIPRKGAMRGGAYPLTTAQRAMMAAAKVIPQPVLMRLMSLACGFRPPSSEPDKECEQWLRQRR